MKSVFERMGATLRLLLVAAVLAAAAVAFSQGASGSDSGAEELDRLTRGISTPPTDTERILVELVPGSNPNLVAWSLGLQPVHALKSDPNRWVFAAPTVWSAQAALRNVQQHPAVVSAVNDQRVYARLGAFNPNDPLFPFESNANPRQWHLEYPTFPERDANVRGAWNLDFTGNGVTVGVVDDAIQISHPDLSPNASAADSYDFYDNDTDPNPLPAPWPNDSHGTSVAGVAVARGGNGIGVTGAAPLARLAGLRLLGGGSILVSDIVDAVLYRSSGANRQIQIKNHSYGIIANPYDPFFSEANAVATSAEAGTIHTYSAGNDRGTVLENTNRVGMKNSPNMILVGAFASNGTYSFYSCFGASVTVTAPSNGGFGITTTDVAGARGYNNTDYNSGFGGTSSSAPLVAGVLALVKQAQPALNVRFAKHLLARTSFKIDPTDSSWSSGGGWRTNGAGINFNPNYGFGAIDATALVQQAQLFSGVTALQTTAPAQVNVNAAIPDNNSGGITRTFSINQTAPLEEVLVRIQVSHPDGNDLSAILRSPSGMESQLMFVNLTSGGANFNWTFMTNAFWGENPAGTWTLILRDQQAGSTGTWSNFQVTLRHGELIPRVTAKLTGVSLNRNWVIGGGGRPARGTVTLDNPAPAGGLTVNLGSSNANADPPTSVTIPGGATSATFDVSGDMVAVATPANITATLGADSFQAPITVYPRPNVTGRLTLQSFTGQLTTVPLQFQANYGDGPLMASGGLLLNAQGDYTISFLDAGPMVLRFRGGTFLRERVELVVDPATGATGVNATLLNGDSDQNNSVGLSDYLILTNAWRATPISANWDIRADLDGNKTVGLSDYLILTRNWRLNGDS